MADKSIDFAGGNNITLSTATAPNATTITISGANAGGAQTGISSIVASDATFTSGQVVFTGTNNVTVLSGADQHVIISGANTHAQQTGLSALYDGANSISSGTVRVTNANNITFTINGQTLSGSVHAPQTGLSALYDGANSISSGTVRLTDANNVTFSINGNTLSASVHAQQTGISGVRASDATYTSGTVIISGGNNITVSSGANQSINIHGPNTHAEQTGLSAIYDGANSISSGTIRFTNANNVTFTINGQTLSGSVHAPQTGISSIVGSDATYTSGSVQFTGSNLVTVKSSANQRIVIDATNQNLSAGVSTGGNTAGDTGVATGSRLVFSGQSNITLSQATGAGATTIGISGPDAGAGAGFSAGVSTGGNTAGSTGVTGTRLVLVGRNDISLSQSTDANGGTISIIPGPNIGFFDNFGGSTALNDLTNMNGSWAVFPYPHVGIFPGNLTAATAQMRLSLSGSTATMSTPFTTTVSLAFYTRNGSTLNLWNSASVTFGFAAGNTDNSTGFVGPRWLTIHSSLWSSQPVFTAGEYWFATAHSTSSRSNQTALIVCAANQWLNSTHYSNSGTIGVATVNATSLGFRPFYGMYSAASASPPAAIQSNDLNKSIVDAHQIPYLQLIGSGPQTY